MVSFKDWEISLALFFFLRIPSMYYKVLEKHNFSLSFSYCRSSLCLDVYRSNRTNLLQENELKAQQLHAFQFWEPLLGKDFSFLHIGSLYNVGLEQQYKVYAALGWRIYLQEFAYIFLFERTGSEKYKNMEKEREKFHRLNVQDFFFISNSAINSESGSDGSWWVWFCYVLQTFKSD